MLFADMGIWCCDMIPLHTFISTSQEFAAKKKKHEASHGSFTKPASHVAFKGKQYNICKDIITVDLWHALYQYSTVQYIRYIAR